MVFLEKGNRTFCRLMSFDCNSVLRSSMSCKDRRQHGRVVSTSDSQSGGPGFESRSGLLLDLCSVVPSLNSWPRL